ncbi:MAG: hypothetical protein HC902_04980 [Calothrix sp. SM1_5_4]|nr:hypothetical protein [Calothrix sp. SM1_5_4]
MANKTADGTYVYSFTQTDGAGNSSVVSAQFVRDTVAPLFAVGSASSATTAGSSHTWTGSCEAGIAVHVTGAVMTSLPCSGGAWTLSVSGATDGLREYVVSQTDAAGNGTSVSLSWTRDTSLPNISLDVGVGATIDNNQNSASWSGVCQTGIDIVVSGSDNQVIPCPAGVFTYHAPAQTSDASRPTR